MSRTRNSAWTLATGSAFSLVSAAAALVAPPFLLRWLGAEPLGAVRSLIDWVSVITFVDLGLSGALMAALARRIGEDDAQATSRLLAAGLRAYWRVTLVQLVGGLVWVAALPRVIALQALGSDELRLAGVIALVPVLLTPLLAFRALAEARQRGYLYWIAMTVQVLAMTVLWLVFAYAGWGVIGQSVAFAVAQVPTVLLLAWDGMHAYPHTRTAVPGVADRRLLAGLSWPAFVHGLTDRVGLASDSVIIAWMLGPAAVVPFFLTQQLAGVAQGQLRGLGSATWAGLAELVARGDARTFRSRVLELTGTVSGLGLAVLTPVAVCNRFFVELWVGEDQYAGAAVTGLACLNAWLWAIFALWGWALLGTGHIRRWVPYAVLSTLLNVVVSLIGTRMLGLVGPLIGTATGLLLVSSWALPRVLAGVFGIPARTLWQMALAPMRWGIPFMAALWLVARLAPPRGWTGVVAMGGLGAVAGLVCWWTLGLERRARAEWLGRVRAVLS